MAVVGVLAAVAVGVATAPGLDSVRTALADGTAWLTRGTDMAHASSSTGEADWLVPDVVDQEGAGQARVAQDGDLTLVVDPAGEVSFSIDAVTLEAGDPIEVHESAVPLVGGGEAYLVSDGVIRWLDPATLEEKASIEVPGRVRATIDDDGVLWAVTARDGTLRRVVRGEVTHEVRVSEPGNYLEVSLAGGQPVIHDTASNDLWFVDRRTAEPGDPVVLPQGSVLQGPSTHGTRAWLATPDGVVGVSPDGEAIEVRRPDGGTPHRPEVIEDRVIVPTHEGTVTVVDESSGDLVTDAPGRLDAAANPDFQTFVKDGVLWFNSPASEVAGTVAPDGTVEVLEVDEDGLRARQEGQPDRDEPINPNQVAPPPAGPAAPAPAAPPTQVQPAPAPAPPAAAPAPAPTTTTTTLPSTTVEQPVAVPNLVDQNVDQACAVLEQQGLQCSRLPSGQYAEPAQVVLSQEPAAGTPVARGSSVAVSYHENAGVVVPQAGDRRSNACGPIEAAGLTCNLIPDLSPNPIQPEGVYDQNPGPGARVGPGSTVNVTHDNRPVATLYQFDNPANYELILSTDAGASGWARTELGRIFVEQAPGTTPLYCWQPNGRAGATNQGHYYATDAAAGNGPYHQPCPTPIVGYVLGPGATGAGVVPIYIFVGYSDYYYSTNANDGLGQSQYVARDAADGWTSHYFSVWTS